LIPGIHASTGGGLVKALDFLESRGLGCGQIFTSNQRRWKGREIREPEMKRFARTGLTVISHASYLINLASTSEETVTRSREALALELKRTYLLGMRWTVMHPGNHLGSGEDGALRRIAVYTRDILFESPRSVGVLFENTAGRGTSVGYSFEHLARILDAVGLPERTGVCLDTCHAFAAGYDISTVTGVDDMMAVFHRTVGLERLAAFHLNDSMHPCGSRRDRHARIGRGMMGLAPLRYLVSMEEFTGCPGVVETPGTDGDRFEDVVLLTGGSGEPGQSKE